MGTVHLSRWQIEHPDEATALKAQPPPLLLRGPAYYGGPRFIWDPQHSAAQRKEARNEEARKEIRRVRPNAVTGFPDFEPDVPRPALNCGVLNCPGAIQCIAVQPTWQRRGRIIRRFEETGLFEALDEELDWDSLP